MIIVFYDGACPICLKEINYYKKIAAPKIFDWIDINSVDNMKSLYNIDSIDALKVMHVIDHFGKIHKGVNAFVIIWSCLEKWKYLACVVKWPVVFQMVKMFYFLFAKWRFKRMRNCDQCKKER